MVTVHQPYFLPWLGFFSKLCYSDKFIVLDNVEFSKGFYHDRTKYVNMDGTIKWLSIPIGQHYKQVLREIEIRDSSFVFVFLKKLEMSYSKADFYRSEWAYLKEIIVSAFKNNQKLIDINITIIKSIINYLEISHPIYLHSSYYDTNLDPTQRIISLCKQTKSKKILIGDGSSLRTHDWASVEKNGIEVFLQPFFQKHPIYKQIRRQKIGFEKGVSILDAILNVGKSGTRCILFEKELKPEKVNFVN